MMSFKKIFFLLQNTPLEKKLLDLNYMLDDTSCSKFEEYKHATRNAVSLLKNQVPSARVDSDFPTAEQDQLILKNMRIRELESANAAMGQQFKNQHAYINNFNDSNKMTPERPGPRKLSKNALNALDYGNNIGGLGSRNAMNYLDTYSVQENSQKGVGRALSLISGGFNQSNGH